MNADPHRKTCLTVRSTELAAALVTLGVPLAPGGAIEKVIKPGGDELHLFHFETGRGGEALVQAWQNDQWEAANPEHPLSYVRAAFHNRNRLMDAMKQAVPLRVVERKGRIFLFRQ